MITTSHSIKFETDLAIDVVDDVLRVHEKLIRRHGDRFRGLERRIEAVLASLEWLRWDDAQIGDNVYVLIPPRDLTDLLVDAKALGV